MSNKMLIDATHPEETRVVVVRDKRVEDFDFETASKRPLRGNIYLAKVTRVEPSLQAAFVEYGGNRHGFLAFSEIHPDYYQIPQADRAALLAEERAHDEAEEDAQNGKGRRRRRGGRDRREERADRGAAVTARADAVEEDVAAEPEAAAPRGADEADARIVAEDAGGEATESAPAAESESGSPVEEVESSSAPDAADSAADVRDGAPPPADGLAAPSSDDESSGFARAIEQVRENMEADAEAAIDAPIRDAERVEEPTRPAEPGEGYEVSEATAETATGPGDAAAVPTAVEPEGDAPAPKPRRRRATTTRKTQKTAEGLADPEVVEADEDEDAEDAPETITSVRGQDVLEEIPERRRTPPRRNYKIQEVIKRRQILLVQVVKEERGTKGAALTTYLSLAGRYSVLMPNTDRGGGVSRKITDNADRRRLKELMEDLEVPEGMGIILRTAGAARTKTEIKRDFEYLLRLWESVRELTLQSIAPKLVYEEGNLVKRAIRDLYSKEIDEILVAGEAAYKEAKDFMRMLMPSHAKNVKPYRDPTPIFTKFGIEPQLDAMFSPQVTLPSKGYIVINPTEALVSIDVNSGRSTKESNIEETAYKTNLEAADEVARQLRLRDLAGLIVIDFIDMDDKRHNRAVETRLKNALKLDRSRIQVGRISPFGLLEMSRQRIRQGMVETSMVACPSCGGTGHVRSTQSVALYCLRALEEHLLKDGEHHVTVRTTAAVALYILNQKRAHLNALEARFALTISIEADETIGGQHLAIETGARVERAEGAPPPPVALVSPDAVAIEEEVEDDVEEAEEETPRADAQPGEAAQTERSGRRRRRRRRRGGGAQAGSETEREEAPGAPLEVAARSDHDEGADVDDEEEEDEEGDGGEAEALTAAAAGEESAEDRRSRRRRGRRGGRRHRREGELQLGEELAEPVSSDRADEALTVTEAAESDGAMHGSGAASAVEDAAELVALGGEEVVSEARPLADAPADAAPADATNGAAREEPGATATVAPDPAPEQKSDAQRPRRVGWWQRRSFF